MQSTAPPTTRSNIREAADLLRRAARGYRNGEIGWAKGSFITDDGCRCLAAAITWAAEPGHPDGDPRFVYGPRRQAVQMAMAALADHLTCDMHWPWAIDDGEISLIETVGGWNDDDGRTVEQVIGLLESVAEIIWPASLAGAR